MLLARATRAVNDLAMSITRHPPSKSAPTLMTVWSDIFRRDRRVWLWRSLVFAAGASAAAIGFLTAGHPYFPLPPGTPSPDVGWIRAMSGCSPKSNTAAADGIVYVACVKTEQSTAPSPAFSTVTLSPTSSPIFSPTSSPDLQKYDLWAMNADNGHIRWIRPLGTYSSSPAVVAANGFVYIGAGDGSVYALDAAAGRTRWIYKTGSPVSSNPTVADGTLYFGSNKGWMYALNAINGHIRWTVPLAGADGIGSPAVAGNTAYVVANGSSSSSSKLYAVNVANGHTRWIVGGSFTSDPAAAGGMIYVSGDQLSAFDAANGHIEWTSRLEESFTTDPAVESGIVYIGSSNGTLCAFSAATGQLRWSYATASFNETMFANQITSAIVANNTVYVATFEIEYALNADNGGIRWAYYNPDLYIINGNPAVLQGAVYLTSEDAMYALSQ
jgi:outer membrane protein assembly factor BamB